MSAATATATVKVIDDSGSSPMEIVDVLLDGPRRSLRKREEKSYAESPDMIIEEDPKPSGGAPNHSNNSNGDVTMKSDEEDDDEVSEDETSAPVSVIPLPKEIPPDVMAERRARIKKLQTRLRNEEMSLVLLKKIKQSQVLAAAAAAVAAKSNNNNSSSNSSNASVSSSGPGGVAVIGGGATITPAKGPIKSSVNSNGRGHHHSAAKSVTDLSQLKPDPKALPPGIPTNLMNLMTQGGLQPPKPKPPPPPPKVDNETPQQKQAAAKLALRKQLEKTLLQIPPPKPPPPEMHFIPNPTNSEFICLLGLEECVSKILYDNNENKENAVMTTPFSCSQCCTDFTPTWKWDKGAKGKEVKVICENCVTTNVKKALKAEHTNRLKSAFVKALQQEQELEAHMAQESAAASAPVSTPRTPRVSSPATEQYRRSGLTVSPALPNSRSSSNPSSSPSPRFPSTNLPAVSITQHRTPVSSSSSSRSQTPRNSRHDNYHRNHSSASVNNHANNSSSKQQSSANNSSATSAAMLGGYDLANMAALQAAAQQQLLLAGNNSSGRNNSGNGNAAAAQMAALSQHFMNPLLYNYQALALQAAMQAAAGMGNSAANSGNNGGRFGSAANQMLELQQQIQRQYLLDMIPPGSLAQTWGGAKK